MAPDAPYVPPSWWYLVRWRIGVRWKQRGFLTREEARLCQETMRKFHGSSGVYHDHDLYTARFMNEPNPPKTATHPHPGGPRARRCLVRWILGKKSRMRSFATEEQATAFHYRLWALEAQSGELYLAHRIWFRMN